MRKYIFRGKRIDNGEWTYGAYLPISKTICTEVTSPNSTEYMDLFVDPDTVGQYTEMNEFIMKDSTVCEPLFEGDIVEVWSRRRPVGENITLYRDNTTSKYDVEIKARAVIYFKYGEWKLDYNNEYNNSICKLKGNEQTERTVDADPRLYSFGVHYNKHRDWFIEHNQHCKHYDIVKIGNIYDNPELLEEKDD